MGKRDSTNDRPLGTAFKPSQESISFSTQEAFDALLRLHRQRATAEEIHFLEHLCFPLDGTSDPTGIRFVLWRPVAYFLQCGFQIEIEEQMCSGQVVLAYLGHDSAELAMKMAARIEAVRREYSLWAVSSGPQLLLHVLGSLGGSF